MGRRVVRKAIHMALILFCISVIGFLIIDLAPGDGMSMYGIREYPEGGYERLQEKMGLDKSPPMRYMEWLTCFLKGDWGISQSQHESVEGLLLNRFQNSIILMLSALILSLIAAVPLGLFAGMTEGKLPDKIISLISFTGVSVPQYWLAMMLIIIFSLFLGILPSTGMRTFGNESVLDLLRHMILPCVSIAFPNTCVFIRYIRANTIEQLNADYVMTAVSKGMPVHRIMFRHVLRNCMLSIITLVAMNFVTLVTGSFIVETVFGWPGMGTLGVSAASCRDYPLIMGVVMLTGILVVASNFAADLLYSVIDPRIKRMVNGV